ncbi:hypothetical protein ABCR94_32910 [Streptomyces sp. 21So2-11]|uniref:hypothetical protein n=1 Tax=Streptomyces sp. 21So2-11 TaxID=3144408 RepID=UPI00321AB3D8
MSGRAVVQTLGDQREVLTTVPTDIVELPGDFGDKRMQGHCVTGRVVSVPVGNLGGD